MSHLMRAVLPGPASLARRSGAVPDPPSPTLRERFRAKVDLDGPVHPVLGTRCHLWTAALDTNGYGHLYAGARNGRPFLMRAHVVAWCLAEGDDSINRPTLNVCHWCDVRHCVNREHLYLATHAVRMADKKDRGRAAHSDASRAACGPRVPSRGEAHAARCREAAPRGMDASCAKLLDADVLAIREARGERYADIGARYGITGAAVGMIRRGDTWEHLGGPRVAVGRGGSEAPRPTKPRLTPEETLDAVLALLPPEDRGGTRRRPDHPYRLGALARLAARLGVTDGMVTLTLREGATLDLIERWRLVLSAVWPG